MDYPGDPLFVDIACMIERDYREAGRLVTAIEVACLVARMIHEVQHDNKIFSDVIVTSRKAWRSALGLPVMPA